MIFWLRDKLYTKVKRYHNTFNCTKIVYVLKATLTELSNTDSQYQAKVHHSRKITNKQNTWTCTILSKPLYNHNILSDWVHFNHFPCMGICDKLSRHLSMLTYIYLNMDECWLTYSMHQQRFKLHIFLNYGEI